MVLQDAGPGGFSIVLKAQMRCPACQCVVELPWEAINRKEKQIHIVRPENRHKHYLSQLGGVCGCRPRVESQPWHGCAVVVHFDKETLQ